MNTLIEIHENNTNETGTYKIHYKNINNENCVKLLSENYVNACLTLKQKENFFMGKFKFKINNYDFKTIILNNEKRMGL